MLDVFNTPTPQTANYQEFYSNSTWIKPRGASMVRFLLIGAGGGGSNGTSTEGGNGGGSGAVTSWIGPAIFIPDSLRVIVGVGGNGGSNGTATSIVYLASSSIGSSLYTLLSANGGQFNGTQGGNMSPNQFTAAGIFNATDGEGGSSGSSSGSGGNRPASTTVFLQGGAGGAGSNTGTGGSVTPTYGYTPLSTTPANGTVKGKDGYFITSPIMVGCGGAGGTTSTTIGSAGGNGGIGCGGGGAGEDSLTGGGRGGNGAVFVWSW